MCHDRRIREAKEISLLKKSSKGREQVAKRLYYKIIISHK